MNQGVEKGMVQLLLLVTKFLLPVLVVVPDRGVLLPGEATNIPLNWKLKLAPGHFGFLCP